eukprot:CAMPEP_0206839938 /NCGR_PEP_ID=MMETSP0975-20121206/21677_1 /ASSEMBLY_ACC=CAM_ASM_000399 /TAXON_ID=483370 /ORGANISM="non described non described, Strain CCMP2097" /LENGTH=37 /DNA_ID= /DNA_START= /DNA_END= /DNA_ORIENTATION=
MAQLPRQPHEPSFGALALMSAAFAARAADNRGAALES